MPRKVLTAILVTEGTDLSVKQIVNTYLSNKEFYDNFVGKLNDVYKEVNAQEKRLDSTKTLNIEQLEPYNHNDTTSKK